MFEYMFGFWEMLLMLFAMYRLGITIGENAGLKRAKKEFNDQPVKITISRSTNLWYAYEERSNKFLAQSSTYEDLQKRLVEINPNISYITNTDALEKLKASDNTNA